MSGLLDAYRDTYSDLHAAALTALDLASSILDHYACLEDPSMVDVFVYKKAEELEAVLKEALDK